MPAGSPVTFRSLSRRAKLCVLAVLLLVTLGGLEVAARVFWQVHFHVPARVAWKAMLPEWDASGVDAVAPHHGDKSFDVLLIGGSTLTDDFGTIAAELKQTLQSRVPWPVRVVNLSCVGRISLETRIKYEWLADKRFDLVVLYDGFNDIYLNNVAPDRFRMDGSNLPHVREMKLLHNHSEMRYFALPATLGYLATHVGDKWGVIGRPRRTWLEYGSDLRSPAMYLSNLEAIAALARDRGDPLVMQSFAYHIPANYSDAAFAAKTLDYDKHLAPVSNWGTTENVRAAITAHNAVVKAVAAEHPEVTFVDQADLIAGGKANFNDCCHMTPTGCRTWVDNLVSALDVPALVRHREAQRRGDADFAAAASR
jgi:hypothetical protein